MKISLLAALAFGAALPVVAGAAVQPGQPRLLPVAERTSCLARHGRVMIAGLSGNEMCALPYRDGGKRCTDGAQCAGDCMFEGSQPRRQGARVSGRCERLQYPFSCRSTISHGRLNNTLCVD